MSLKILRWLHRRGFSRRKLRGGVFHRWVGDHIFCKSLWRFEKDSVARAWFWGMLVTCSPLMGVQILTSLVLAVIFRANIPISFLLQWMSNPVTILVYYPFALYVGCILLGRSTSAYVTDFEMVLGERGWWAAAENMLNDGWQPLLLGCTLIGLLLGVVGYALIHSFWPSLAVSSKKNSRPIRTPEN